MAINPDIPRRVRVLQKIGCEAPCPQGGASWTGSFAYILPLDPAYKAGLAGHLPVRRRSCDYGEQNTGKGSETWIRGLRYY